MTLALVAEATCGGAGGVVANLCYPVALLQGVVEGRGSAREAFTHPEWIKN